MRSVQTVDLSKGGHKLEGFFLDLQLIHDEYVFFCWFFYSADRAGVERLQTGVKHRGKKNTEMWKYTSNLIDSTRRLPFLLEALLPALD